MKKLMLIIATLFITAGVYAQGNPMGTTSDPVAATPPKYVCPKCGSFTNKPGTCAHCKTARVLEGTYYCPACGTTSAQAGKCPKCKADMKKVVAKTDDAKAPDAK